MIQRQWLHSTVHLCNRNCFLKVPRDLVVRIIRHDHGCVSNYTCISTIKKTTEKWLIYLEALTQTLRKKHSHIWLWAHSVALCLRLVGATCRSFYEPNILHITFTSVRKKTIETNITMFIHFHQSSSYFFHKNKKTSQPTKNPESFSKCFTTLHIRCNFWKVCPTSV